MKFNKHFGKNGTEYIDITLGSDTELYVDPNRIKHIQSDMFDSEVAKAKVDSYFLSIFDLYMNGETELAIDLLDTPKEINATHFGLSKGESKGNGPSREILHRFFETVTSDGRLAKPLLARPVLIPLFVKNFGPDRFSDLIVNIISKELADFTKCICDIYSIPTQTSQICTYFNIETGQWEELVSELPVGPDNKPILLVPTELATSQYGFSALQYINTIIFIYLQAKHLSEGNQSPLVKSKNKGGTMTLVQPTKKELYKYEISEAYSENGKIKAFALEESLKNPHLLKQYIDFVEGRRYELKKDSDKKNN